MSANLRSKDFQKNQLSHILPPNLLLPIAIVGIIVVAASMVFEYRSRKQDYTRLLENQATLFIKTLSRTAQNAFTAAGELEEEISSRMMANLHLIDQFDQLQSISLPQLKKFMRITQFDEIRLYSPQGNLLRHTGKDINNLTPIPGTALESAQRKNFREMIYSFPETGDTANDQLAVMIPRKKGGIIAGIITADHIQKFRKLFGFGHFLKRFQSGSHVKYIVLENPETIVAGIFSGYSMSSFPEDPFLEKTLRENVINTRILTYPQDSISSQHSIFEAVAPFNFAGR